MRITVEVSKQELEELNFENIDSLKEFIYSDLDDARDYPGYNINVKITDEIVL